MSSLKKWFRHPELPKTPREKTYAVYFTAKEMRAMASECRCCTIYPGELADAQEKLHDKLEDIGVYNSD